MKVEAPPAAWVEDSDLLAQPVLAIMMGDPKSESLGSPQPSRIHSRNRPAAGRMRDLRRTPASSPRPASAIGCRRGKGRERRRRSRSPLGPA